MEQIQEWTSEAKTLYRGRKQWKTFRLKVVKLRDGRCDCCGVRYLGARKKQLQVHHLWPSKYDLLEIDRFKLLCSQCHQTVEALATRLVAAKKTLVNEDKWLALYGDYLPREGDVASYVAGLVV